MNMTFVNEKLNLKKTRHCVYICNAHPWEKSSKNKIRQQRRRLFSRDQRHDVSGRGFRVCLMYWEVNSSHICNQVLGHLWLYIYICWSRDNETFRDSRMLYSLSCPRRVMYHASYFFFFLIYFIFTQLTI